MAIPPGCTPEVRDYEDNRLSAELETATIEEQIEELLEAGWWMPRNRRTQWYDPETKTLWRGPHGAWKEMKRRQARTPADPNAMEKLRRTLEATRDEF